MESGQNRSHAVMAQRHEAHDSLDFFPTPPWAVRALCEHVIDLRGRSIWEPACGNGSMVRPLSEYTAYVEASDIHDHGARIPRFFPHDFLMPYLPEGFGGGLFGEGDWIVTNPPFRLGEQFARRALDITHGNVALLVRTAFLESQERYRLFTEKPPSVIAQFVERVPMVKGRLDPKASTATAYCWIVWQFGKTDTRFRWIPPCRKSLERTGDYESH